LVKEGDPLFALKRASAMDRLMNILETKTIFPSPMPFLPRSPRAVCFTECTWDALVHLSEKYSYYGVVFSKRVIFEKGGGPALYVRGDLMKGLGENLPTAIEPFVQPFDPVGVIKTGIKLDYIH
jgi:hypothetical protein